MKGFTLSMDCLTEINKKMLGMEILKHFPLGFVISYFFLLNKILYFTSFPTYIYSLRSRPILVSLEDSLINRLLFHVDPL